MCWHEWRSTLDPTVNRHWCVKSNVKPFSILNSPGPLRAFRSCSHTVYGYMWISALMVNVCIRSQSFRMGGGRSKIYLLSVFQIYLWIDPCKTMFGSSQRSNYQIFLKFYEKRAMGKHKSIATHSSGKPLQRLQIR